MTPRKAFFTFDCVSANIALLIFMIWLVYDGMPLSTALFIYLLTLAIGAGAFALRWVNLKSRPQPSVIGRALLRKLLFGNAVGLGFMVMFYLQGQSPAELELMGLLIFVVGNLVLFMEWLWQKSYLRRSGQQVAQRGGAATK